MAEHDELIECALTKDERHLLSQGLVQWGGPCYPTEAIAVAIGFGSLAEFREHRNRIADAVDSGRPLSGRDWRRALVATEIAFASDVYGAGVEWSTVTRFTDDETVSILRAVQRKLVSIVG